MRSILQFYYIIYWRIFSDIIFWQQQTLPPWLMAQSRSTSIPSSSTFVLQSSPEILPNIMVLSVQGLHANPSHKSVVRSKAPSLLPLTKKALRCLRYAYQKMLSSHLLSLLKALNHGLRPLWSSTRSRCSLVSNMNEKLFLLISASS